MKNKIIVYISIFLFVLVLAGCGKKHIHNYSIEWEWGENILAVFSCDCGPESTQKILAVTEEVIIEEADCINEGSLSVTAKTLFNNELYTKTEVISIPKKDHDIEIHEAKEPTCSQKGWEEYETCTRCNYSTYKEIETIDHNLEIHEAKEPTCSQKGWEEYATCTRCNYSTYREVDTIPHDIIIDIIDPGFVTEGYSVDTCANCDYLYEHSYTPPILKLELEDGYYIVTGINGNNISNIVIPEEYNDLPIKKIDNFAFENCTNLVSVEIPNSVTSIGDFAFYNCGNLISIEIPDGVTSIGDFTFYNCKSLISIEIPDGVTSIGDYAFFYCKSLTSIEIPDGVTSIGDNAFNLCTNLTNVIIPNNVVSVGELAFSNCDNLASIEIPDSVASIGNNAFSHCMSLTSIEVSEGNETYKSIAENLYTKDGKQLLQYASGKKEDKFIIPFGVTSIGDNAFNLCTSLTSIEIPGSVTSIGDNAFSGCTSLTNINVSDDNEIYKSIDGNLYSKDGKQLLQCAKGKKGKFIIPNGVTSIGEKAFYNCEGLEGIEIPDTVTSIGDYALCDCINLTSIEISDSVISIGNSAFRNCINLTIYCETKSKPVGWNISWNPTNCLVIWGNK